jgi:hypothetical protein
MMSFYPRTSPTFTLKTLAATSKRGKFEKVMLDLFGSGLPNYALLTRGRYQQRILEVGVEIADLFCLILLSFFTVSPIYPP